MAWNVTERVYSNPGWRKTLLETPSGFALFDVSQDALKKDNVLGSFLFLYHLFCHCPFLLDLTTDRSASVSFISLCRISGCILRM